MAAIDIRDGFDGTALAPLHCEDGGGRIDRYALFDGVTVMRIHLETHGFSETRPKRDGLEINFCVNGRFESSFSARDAVALKPGDLAVNLFDGVHGASSRSCFPLGCYEGVCIDVDCAAASAWMTQNVKPLATDFEALKQNLLEGRWYMAAEAGPRCEHVFRELFENLPYFDREYLQLKVLEMFLLLRSIPRAELSQDYCSAGQLRLAQHLRDHLLSDRGNYVSLAELSREHHLSVSRLQKLFRQVYGVPIYHYLKEYRLEQAAVELTGTRRPITEIALNAGYDSASKFSQAFKKRYHATPSAYRAAADLVLKRANDTKMD